MDSLAFIFLTTWHTWFFPLRVSLTLLCQWPFNLWCWPESDSNDLNYGGHKLIAVWAWYYYKTSSQQRIQQDCNYKSTFMSSMNKKSAISSGVDTLIHFEELPLEPEDTSSWLNTCFNEAATGLGVSGSMLGVMSAGCRACQARYEWHQWKSSSWSSRHTLNWDLSPCIVHSPSHSCYHYLII